MTTHLDFPAGNSETARAIKAIDWQGFPLGPPAQWPSALRVGLNLILNSPESMYLLWGPQLLFFHNDAYAPLLGPRKANALGAVMQELWGDVWDQVSGMIEQALSGQAYQCQDLPLTMARFGEIEQTWWSFSFSALFDENSHIVGMFCTTRETTERVLNEQALRVSEAKRLELIADLVSLEKKQTARLAQRTAELDCLWEMSPDLLAMVDLDGRFLRVNPAWTTVLGWLPEALVGTHVNELAHPDDIEATRTALAMSLEHPLPLFENRYRHQDGSYRWMAWTAAPGNGMVVALGKHMTAEKERSKALQVIEEALRQSQKMEAVGQLTGGLAHDFNNLLMGITGNIELLQIRVAQGRTGELGRYLAASLEASRRAAALTHRLLAFSRRQTLDPKATHINQLVEGMEELIRRTVGPSIVMQVNGAADLWPTLVDPHQLENALLNLCINARDAMPDGGTLLIETHNRVFDTRCAIQGELAPGQYVELCVSDTGTGMTAEVLERAFDPFFTTKPIGMGTGLGLSMIYGFARQSGGDVRIFSTLGQGSKICLFLPRQHGESIPLESSAGPQQHAAAATGGSGTVLVVDDEPAVRLLITEVLKDLGYDVLQAQDGATALTLLQSKASIDLLITDVGLPGAINGRQVADAARSLRPTLNVLFVTGYAENAVLGEGALEPGMHVLTKPFSIPALTDWIGKLLEGDAQKNNAPGL
ncbi:PAS domain S-box protein [Pseudomonas sp. Pseusp122]|uniref:hybrid sensor histidine kinase/response regulator n=1 Tax=unclassified Pseudomonas TaxID=196821 RepID=UPI0039A5452B